MKCLFSGCYNLWRDLTQNLHLRFCFLEDKNIKCLFIVFFFKVVGKLKVFSGSTTVVCSWSGGLGVLLEHKWELIVFCVTGLQVIKNFFWRFYELGMNIKISYILYHLSRVSWCYFRGVMLSHLVCCSANCDQTIAGHHFFDVHYCITDWGRVLFLIKFYIASIIPVPKAVSTLAILNRFVNVSTDFQVNHLVHWSRGAFLLTLC